MMKGRPILKDDVIYVRGGVLDGYHGFLVYDSDLEKLKELKRLAFKSNRQYDFVIKLIILAAYRNIDVNYPPGVYLSTYYLYTSTWGNAHVMNMAVSYAKILDVLAGKAAVHMATLIPQLMKNVNVNMLSRDLRLGFDFSLAVFQHFLETDWKDAVYTWGRRGPRNAGPGKNGGDGVAAQA